MVALWLGVSGRSLFWAAVFVALRLVLFGLIKSELVSDSPQNPLPCRLPV